MKRKDFYQILQPLLGKLYNVAFSLVPDDLQSEQLVIDSVNAYLIKEKKSILRREIDLLSKKETQVYRRIVFKGILRYLSDIGIRRSLQLSEQLRLTRPEEYAPFFSMEPKVRLILKLRYELQFTVEEIVEIGQMPRYEVIEKVHNGRFLLMNDLNKGVSL
jgi:hypothetical protein